MNGVLKELHRSKRISLLERSLVLPKIWILSSEYCIRSSKVLELHTLFLRFI